MKWLKDSGDNDMVQTVHEKDKFISKVLDVVEEGNVSIKKDLSRRNCNSQGRSSRCCNRKEGSDFVWNKKQQDCVTFSTLRQCFV